MGKSGSPPPSPAALLQNLGEAERLLARGHSDDALAILERMGQAAANSAEYQRLRGEALGHLRDMAPALKAFERAVRLAPRRARYRVVLAQHHRHMGDMGQALASLTEAVKLEPLQLPLRRMLAEWLVSAGEMNRARMEARAIVAQAGLNTDLLLEAGSVLESADALDEAIAAVGQAARLRPEDPVIARALRRLYARSVPAWHFPMMNDTARNRAYQTALEQAVGPETDVIDLGCGGGLLSLLAARAGARRVTAIEANPNIAAAAAEIMQRNGVADRVRVIPKVSTQCVIGEDLAAPADLLVHEILSDAVLGEYVHASVRHARQHLLKPGARIIPHTISAMGALIGGEGLKPWLYVDKVSGFDMGPFNRFVSDVISLRLDDRTYVLQSEAREIFTFDLREDEMRPQQRTIVFTARVAGPCCGVALWNRLHLADDVVFDNQPEPGALRPSAWAHVLYPLPAPVDLAAGDKIAFAARHDTVALHLTPTGRAAAAP